MFPGRRSLVLAAVFWAAGLPCARADGPPVLTPAQPLAISGSPTLSAVTAPLAPGQYIRISSVCPDASSDLRLIDAAKKPVSFAPGLSGTGGAAEAALVVTEAVPLTIEVHLLPGEPVRACTLSIIALRPATDEDRRDAAAYRDYARTLETKDRRPLLAAVIQAAETAHDRFLQLVSTLALSRALIGAGEYEKGVATAQAALPLAESAANPRAQAALFYAMALGRLQQQNAAEAAPLFERSLALARQTGQPYETAAALHNLSVCRWYTGACSQALDGAQQAHAIRHNIHDRFGEAYSLLAIAKDHVCLGDSQEALDAYAAVLPIWRELKDQRNEAAVLNDRGVVYTYLGDWDAADSAHRAALALRTAIGDRAGIAESLDNLGELKNFLHDWPAARKYFEQALPIFREIHDRRGEAYALNGLSQAQLTSRAADPAANLHESIRLLQQIGDRTGEAWAWRILGELNRSRHDLAAAQSAYERALSLERQSGDRTGETVALVELARLYRNANDRPRALASVNDALRNIETARADLAAPNLRAAYLASQREAYALRIALVDDAEAFATSEQSHARVLLDAVAQAPSERPDPAALQREVLDRNTVLLEYFVGEDRGYLFSVTPHSIRRFPLPGRASLERAIRGYYAALTERNTQPATETLPARAARLARADAEAARAARELRQLLLGPVAPSLARKRLVIVPDGPLSLVPFAALVDAGQEVVRLPSASVLAEMRRKPAARALTPALIVADPVFDPHDPRLAKPPAPDSAPAETALVRSAADTGTQSFVRLRWSREEARALASLLPPSQADELLDFSASLPAFLHRDLAHYGVLHFATHALLDTARPELSGIVLSTVDPQGRRQNGFLRVRDIYRLPLRARLVVLSACRTALGKDIAGEGAIGLSRGFLYAGAQSVLATLWNVDDRATAQFMDRFYQGIWKQNLRPAAALQSAQQWMRTQDRWRSPYYWAAFTLTGDWR